MKREEFAQLVQKLEAVAQRNPQLYVARVVMLVALAYGYLAIVCLLALTLIGLVVVAVVAVPNGAIIKLAIVMLVVAGGLILAIVRGLWVKMEPPKGIELTRADAPALFDALEQLSRDLNCRPFHRVLLTDDFNAAVVQVPRLGMLGWHRNYLILGMPLMQSLGPDEFRAVMAHEFAHLSGGHGRLGNWLYRIRRSWNQVFDQMAKQKTGGAWVLTKFLDWYWPKFNAYAFVLARANEYEADAASARLAGPTHAAQALMRLPVSGQLLDEHFWPQLFKRANHEPAPPGNAFVAMATSLRTPVDEEKSARWLKHAFLMETNTVDTHPCLRDRLKALGQLPAGVEHGEFPKRIPHPSQSAADAYLGTLGQHLAAEISAKWQASVHEAWAQRHKEAVKLREQLHPTLPFTGSEPIESIWKRASALIDLEGDTDAQPLVLQVLEREPAHIGANFVRGRFLLKNDQPEGVAFIERAIAEDDSLTEAGINVLYGHFTRTGQRPRLRELEERMDCYGEEQQLAMAERNQISKADTFLQHELPAPVVAEVVNALQQERDLGRAALVRKQVKHFPKSPMFAIALVIKPAWWKPRSSSANGKLVQRVIDRINLPGYFIVFVVENDLKAAGKKVLNEPGAIIYERHR